MRLQNELISKIIIAVQDYTSFKVISNLKLGNVNNIVVELFVSKILNFHKNAEWWVNQKCVLLPFVYMQLL